MPYCSSRCSVEERPGHPENVWAKSATGIHQLIQDARRVVYSIDDHTTKSGLRACGGRTGCPNCNARSCMLALDIVSKVSMYRISIHRTYRTCFAPHPLASPLSLCRYILNESFGIPGIKNINIVYIDLFCRLSVSYRT